MSRPLKELLVEIDALKKEVDAVRPLKPEQEQRIMQKFRLDWNFHSNAIEGNKLSQGETRVFLLEGLTAHGKPLKDHLDIRGHDEVISWLLDFIRRKAELSEADIRGLHRVLLVEPYQVEAVTAEGKKTQKWIKLGEYKSEPNQVTTPTGATRIFALPEDTPAKMGELVAWYRRQMGGEQLHPVITSALVHHQFVAIHPFDDGNGRMARILMNLILMQDGFPPVVIQLGEREKYFFALAKADAGETEDFVSFIAEKLIASLQLYLRGARGESIEEADDLDKKLALLSKELEKNPEPVVLTDGIYQEFVDGSLRYLLTRLVTKMGKFDKFFSERGAQVTASSQSFNLSSSGMTVEQLIEALKSRGRGHDIYIRFNWAWFKAKPLDHVSCSAEIKISFSQLYFEVEFLKRRPRHLYAAGLKPEQWEEIVNELAETVFKEIEHEIKPPPPKLPSGIML